MDQVVLKKEKEQECLWAFEGFLEVSGRLLGGGRYFVDVECDHRCMSKMQVILSQGNPNVNGTFAFPISL